jgi:molybdopterin-guanine dinucleotide biosynthesis protein A
LTHAVADRKHYAISGTILAGGRSTRLGRDKAFLRLDGSTLIERIVDTVAQVSEEVTIVVNDIDAYEGLDARVVTDVYPGKGALGGIFSGLRAASAQHALVVACDMPFLNISLLRYMRELSQEYDIVIPRLGILTEPLHAIYSRVCLPAIERQLRAENLRIANFFAEFRVRYVGREEIEAFDPEHLSFFNINNQSDLARAREIWHREQSHVPWRET